jgi:hypothetical protein
MLQLPRFELAWRAAVSHMIKSSRSNQLRQRGISAVSYKHVITHPSSAISKSEHPASHLLPPSTTASNGRHPVPRRTTPNAQRWSPTSPTTEATTQGQTQGQCKHERKRKRKCKCDQRRAEFRGRASAEWRKRWFQVSNDCNRLCIIANFFYFQESICSEAEQ